MAKVKDLGISSFPSTVQPPAIGNGGGGGKKAAGDDAYGTGPHCAAQTTDDSVCAPCGQSDQTTCCEYDRKREDGYQIETTDEATDCVGCVQSPNTPCCEYERKEEPAPSVDTNICTATTDVPSLCCTIATCPQKASEHQAISAGFTPHAVAELRQQIVERSSDL